MTTFTVDAQGVRVPSLEEALTNVRNQLSAIFGEDLSAAAQTPQGQLAGVIAMLEAVVGEALVSLGNVTDIDASVGAQLDRICGLLDVYRVLATKSRVTATLTGVAGTTVARGSRARTTEDAVFETVADVVLAPSPGVSVDMQSVEDGPVVAEAGTLTQIVTVVPGWETVTNGADAVLGMSRQGDPAYRSSYRVRTAHRAEATLAALSSALESAAATKHEVVENRTGAALTEQGLVVDPHHVLVVARGGTDTDITRAVENHRGMGCGTMVAIVGGAPNEGNLDTTANGTITWDGTAYTGLDLRGGLTSAQKAAAVTTLLAGTGVTVRAVDGLYLAMFGWKPGETPNFGDGATEVALGLAPAASNYPPGPFLRPRERPLTVTATFRRSAQFPANGLELMRAAVNRVVEGYEIGGQAWLGDFTVAIESIPGTRAMSLSVQHSGADVSGIDIPLDALWTLPDANLDLSAVL